MGLKNLDFLREYIYIILGALCVVIIGIIYIFARGGGGRVIVPGDVIYQAGVADAYEYEYEPAVTTVAEPEIDEPGVVIVHIVGEVNNPGVFELTEGSRVNHALQLAGGATDYADLARVNLAAVLVDAMQIIIPAVGDDVLEVFVYDEAYVRQPQTTVEDTGIAGGLVNINTATSAELQTLPGIGPAIASNIIEYRESHGGFNSVEDLINVVRIGSATLERLRGLVRV